MSKKKILITSIFLLAVGISAFIYFEILPFAKGEQDEYKKRTEAFIARTKKEIYADSVRKWAIFRMYQSIKISHEWATFKGTGKTIGIGITTEPAIYLDYSSEKDNFNVSYNVREYINKNDSLVFETTSSSGDTIIIWTFKPKTETTGIWSMFNAKTSSYKQTGTYKAVNR